MAMGAEQKVINFWSQADQGTLTQTQLQNQVAQAQAQIAVAQQQVNQAVDQAAAYQAGVTLDSVHHPYPLRRSRRDCHTQSPPGQWRVANKQARLAARRPEHCGA
jgi:hypothetical protein